MTKKKTSRPPPKSPHPDVIFRDEDKSLLDSLLRPSDSVERARAREAVTLVMCPCCRGRGMVTPMHAERCHVDPIPREE